MKRIRPTFWWLLPLGAVAATVLLAVWVTPAPKPPALVRCVGPPLPDGSRVTFLHPASLSLFWSSPINKPPQPWIVQSIFFRNPEVMTRTEAIWYKLPIAGPVPVRDLAVDVRVTNVSQTYLSKGLIVSGRREQEYVYHTPLMPSTVVIGSDSDYGGARIDEVDIADAPRGRQYAFSYAFLSNSQSKEFAAHKAAIVSSFQVLPPGARPPVP